MSRTALRNAVALALLALAAASTIAQPKEAFVGKAADSAQAMTLPPRAQGVAAR